LKTLIFTLSVALIACRAQARPEPTVADMIAACDSNDREVRKQECDKVFGSLLIWTAEAYSTPSYRAPDSPKLCIPFTNDDPMTYVATFEKSTLGWLRAHPEVHSKPMLDGLRDATLAVYTCGK